jgi:hypothetical protein
MEKRIQLNEAQLKNIIRESIEEMFGMNDTEENPMLNRVSEVTDCMKEVSRCYKNANQDQRSYQQLGVALRQLFHCIKVEMGIE